jgi:hypothetical protein
MLQFAKHGIHNVDRVVNHQGNAERCSCGEAAGLPVAADEHLLRLSLLR